MRPTTIPPRIREATATTLHCRGAGQAALHDQANRVREAFFGREVFIRGVVEVSNYCRENCAYCGMRRDNRDLKRYRLKADELAELLIHHRPPSVRDINIQAGEDPVAVREVVIPLIRELRRSTDLGISVCLGTLSDAEYGALREAGASYYIIKIETGDPDHYREMKAPGNFEERIEAIGRLARSGWDVSSGMVMGLPGQSDKMVLGTLSLLAELPLAGCSVSPFFPGGETLLAQAPAASCDSALNVIALMRVGMPDRIIPAVSAMNLLDPQGYERALRAGANLATINLTPPDPRGDYLLYARERAIMTEERVLDAIGRAGYRPAGRGAIGHLNAERGGSDRREARPPI
jgi:biotin synthase